MDIEKTNIKYRFSRSAIICGCLASAFYALNGVMIWRIHSIPKPLLSLVGFSSIVGPAMCLIAPGVVIRPISIQHYLWFFFGIIGSLFFLVARTLYTVKYAGGPPPPWPDFSIFGFPTLFATLACLLFATFLADIQRKWWLKLFSPLLAVSITLVISLLFQQIFPQQNFVYIQRWEFVAILFGGPCLCFCTWFPFDLIKNIEQEIKEFQSERLT